VRAHILWSQTHLWQLRPQALLVALDHGAPFRCVQRVTALERWPCMCRTLKMHHCAGVTQGWCTCLLVWQQHRQTFCMCWPNRRREMAGRLKQISPHLTKEQTLHICKAGGPPVCCNTNAHSVHAVTALCHLTEQRVLTSRWQTCRTRAERFLPPLFC
jgi:hypothetical protein